MDTSDYVGLPVDEVALRGVVWEAAVSAVATTLVFIPILVSDPSTTQAVPPVWVIGLILAAPLSAYLVSRHRGPRLNLMLSLAAGLPQVPVFVLLSMTAIWLDVQRGHLGLGSEAMSYGIGMPISVLIGCILLFAVATGTRLGARNRRQTKKLRSPSG